MKENITVKDLVEYLMTLKQDKLVNATYIRTVLGNVIDEEIRPLLLENLFKEDQFSYTMKPLYY